MTGREWTFLLITCAGNKVLLTWEDASARTNEQCFHTGGRYHTIVINRFLQVYVGGDSRVIDKPLQTRDLTTVYSCQTIFSYWRKSMTMWAVLIHEIDEGWNHGKCITNQSKPGVHWSSHNAVKHRLQLMYNRYNYGREGASWLYMFPWWHNVQLVSGMNSHGVWVTSK